MLSQCDGLCVLHVRESRHHSISVVLGDGDERIDQQVDVLHGLEGHIPEIHPEVRGHLIVPTPPCVKFSAGRSNHVSESELYIRMDILQRFIHLEFAVLHLGSYGLETLDNPISIIGWYYLTFLEHSHMC